MSALEVYFEAQLGFEVNETQCCTLLDLARETLRHVDARLTDSSRPRMNYSTMLNPALLAPFVNKIENVQELMETASALADDLNRATAGVTEATQGDA